MALRDQPYLPLYVQDFLTDEKLVECSAQANGVYIRIMCLMHKSEQYGTILVGQKDKQNMEQSKNFAAKLARQMPFSEAVILDSLRELLHEKVLVIDGDTLIQGRMKKDGELSITRAKTGAKGVRKQRNYLLLNLLGQKQQQKTENESVNENEIKNVIKVAASEKNIQYPNEVEFLEHAKYLLGAEYPSYEFSLKAKFKSWSVEWKDGFGKKIKNWKTKLNNTIPHLGKMKVAPEKIELSTANDYTAGFPSQTK